MLSVGIILRIAPSLLRLDYILINDLGDTAVHYFGSQELANGFLEENIAEYEKMYPYLFSYTFLLSIFVKIFFGNINCAIAISNLFFDYAGIFLLYRLLEKIKGKNSARLGIIIALINPFSIIACWLPLNLIVVNFLLLVIITICINIIYDKNTSIFSLCILLGLIVSFANYFRPLFSVALVAMCIILLMKYLKTKDKKQLLGIMIMASTLIITTSITNKIINRALNENVMDNTGGWNFYVGSNYESKGKWSTEDRDFFFGEISPYYSVDTARKMIMREGIERYSSYSPWMFVNHAINKLSVLFGDEGNAISDIKYCYNINGESVLYSLCASIVSVYFSLITLGNMINCIYNRKSKEDDILLLRLLLLGFTASFLIVEVMNRYTMIMYPILIMTSSLNFDNPKAPQTQ